MPLVKNLVSTSGLLTILYFLFYAHNLQAALFVTLILIVLKYSSKQKTKGRLPPGPKSFPIFGFLRMLFIKNQEQYIADQHKEYGPIITIEFGRTNIISVSDYNLCKQLSQLNEFQDRPTNTWEIHNSGLGIVMSEGPTWKHQRRFMVQALKDSGMGKLRMQDKILDELSRVMAEFDKNQGRPMSVHKTLEKSTFNLISALAFNKQFDYDDPILSELIACLDQNFRLYEIMDMLSDFWWTRPITMVLDRLLMRNSKVFRRTSMKIIEEHKSTLDPDNPRDYIDLYLMEMSKEKSGEEKEYLSTFFEDQLITVMTDLFLAGTETSSTTIRWAILYMSHYPQVQEKVQKELDDVVGLERLPVMEDKLNLPFTAATLQEIERLASIAPAALPKSNRKTEEFNGYTIPAKSFIALNLYAIHRDPNIWKNPDQLKPERFINENGKVFRPPQLMPFGTGKRSCPGESLAKMEIFLYFASLLQRYTFKPANDGDSLNPATVTSLVRSPVPYQVRAIKRQQIE